MTPKQPTDLTLQFQYTEAEYIAAIHAYYNRSFHMQTYIIGLSVVLLAGLCLWFSTGEPVIFFAWSIFLLIVAVPLIFYFVTPRTAFRREPSFRNIYRLHFSEDSIEFQAAHVNSRLDWALYQQVWENEDFYLLFYGKRLFTIIPKRVFESIAQESQFRELLQRKITANFLEF